MRVAVLAGLVAVAMSAPTWTSQLAAETNAQAVTTELSALDVLAMSHAEVGTSVMPESANVPAASHVELMKSASMEHAKHPKIHTNGAASNFQLRSTQCQVRPGSLSRRRNPMAKSL